jgi:hypothetical protein
MKKQLFILLATGLFSMAANAQMKASIGPNAGFGGSWIDNWGEGKYKPAGNFGVSLIYSGKSNFGIGADLKYSFEGGKREYTTSAVGTSFTTTEEAKLDYVRLPLKAIFFMGKYGQRLRPKLAVGPSFGLLVGGKTNIQTVSQTGAVVFEQKNESEDVWDKWDVGVHGSAGFNYRLVKNTWFSADIAYMHGLTDVRNDDRKSGSNNPGYTAGQNYKNRNLGVNVGVYFGF